MALSGELMRYIGNEFVPMATKTASSSLSSVIPSAITKTGTSLATKAGTATLNGLVPKMATASASPDMVTLYRGLTQKYDPKYPVAKLDTSGYESWTDNPELARQYGDYVYSIDVPKADIKNGYLDENPNSPTYGDRNPIYRIDKKAGINGVSGKEYLLEVGSDYQKGLTYNKVPSEVEIAVKNSGVGSDVAKRADSYLGGRMLDKSGKPMTFYHSTPNEFSKFDDARLGENTGYDNTALGHFVTTDKDFSKRFIDIDNTGKTGRTMELQAKIQKPITHPYMAGQKYDEKELDKIVEDYLIATNNQDSLESLRELAEEDGTSLYDAYMDLTFGGDSPFEYSADDRKALLDNGYDAVEIVEGPKSGLVDGSNDDSVVSSYAVLNGENLRPVRHIPVNSEKSVLQSLNVNRGNEIPLYRGIHADSPANLQKYIAEMKDPNIVPRTYTGNAFAGDGYHFYDNIEGAREYARDGVNLGEPYGAVVKIDVPKNRFIGINSQNGNDAESFVGRALERGANNAPEVGSKDFRNYIQKNGILGSHNTGPFGDNSQYVVMNNEATAGLEAIENYENGQLMEDIVNSGADKYLPAGTKIKFDKDLNIKDIEKPSRGRGWYADNETNPHISQVVKQNGLDKYLGEPKVSQSLVELSPIVADENGVAKTFYHGSPSMDITDFDINMAGKNTRSGERAIWFTDDYPTAEEFSYERIPGDTLFADKRGAKGKVYERNLGLENPLDLSNLSDKQIEELYKYADSRMAFDGKDNFIRRMKEFRDAGNDQLIKSQLDMKKLSNSEYDGIVAKMYPGESEVREIGVFDTKKIKRLDNKK